VLALVSKQGVHQLSLRLFAEGLMRFLKNTAHENTAYAAVTASLSYFAI